MRERLLGYWALSWVGLIGNIIALPTIAAGQPRLIARVIFATFSGGPKLIINAIIGSAIMLPIKPTHESAQYPNTLSLIIYCFNY